MNKNDSRDVLLHAAQPEVRGRGDLQHALHNDLVIRYRGLAESAAAGYLGPGREVEDLCQVAYLGLIKAVRRFDPARGESFAAFAVPTIHGELKRHLRDHAWMVRPPRRLQDLRTAAAKVHPGLSQRLGRDATIRELARELGEPPADVAEALGCSSSLRPDSLDAPGPGGLCPDLEDVVGRELEHSEDVLMLRQAMRCLSATESELLILRYFHELSQQAIGDRLGLTQMQVSRQLARILVKLQQQLLDPSEGTDRRRTAPDRDGAQTA